MSDVFTTCARPALATNLSRPGHKSLLYDTNTEPIAAGSWNGPRSEQRRGQAVSGESAPQGPPRIRIDVPVAASYLEIQAGFFRHTWRLAGTRLRAALALGITPETISRILPRSARRRIACPEVPEAWPLAGPPEPPPEVNRVIER